jgi:hypothetical protein
MDFHLAAAAAFGYSSGQKTFDQEFVGRNRPLK